MERAKGRAVTRRGLTKTAVTPATGDLMYAREDSKLPEDQRKFMSLNATLMYASKRTYPEISFAVFIYHHGITRLRRATMIRR